MGASEQQDVKTPQQKQVKQKTKYVAKKPDAQGMIHYTSEEHDVWRTLYQRQIKLIQNRACQAFVDGVAALELNPDEIPQCKTISERLRDLTGWSVKPVEALISFEEFFNMLANKQFPAASFIRIPEELDYLMEPDIFHELFGHGPMLTHPAFAEFTQAVGQLGAQIGRADRSMLARLYWFTVEFGLINTAEGLRIYGGGILSSKGETVYALESDEPQRQPFDLLTVLRMPYRYDEMQKNYFIIDDFRTLYDLAQRDLLGTFAEARKLGMLPNPHDEPITQFRSC